MAFGLLGLIVLIGMVIGVSKFSIIILVVLVIGTSIGIRALAQMKKPFLWFLSPAQTLTLITTVANENPNLSLSGGGGLTGIAHNVPGRKLNTTDPDPNGWYFEKGTEHRGLLYHRNLMRSDL